MKKLITLFLLLPIFCLAQKQGNIWYFGGDYNNPNQIGTGLDFNTPVPTLLTNSAMNFTEGSSSYCNSAGQLLFYAKGDTVYDRTHNIMLNGTNLGGHSSSLQSVLIVPITGDTNKYYIINNDGFPTGNGTGLYYSVIDMELNGNLGAVKEPKAINLISNTGEQLTGCMHSNGLDFWVITTNHNTSTFYSFQVTPTGVLAPIVSNLGFNTDFTGALEISPNANQVAILLSNGNRRLINFDNNTGLFSNSIIIGNPRNNNGPCGFSPNGNLFYDFESNWPGDSLFQYDLTAADVTASKLFIYSRPVHQFQYDSRIGPDGKLYFSGTTYNPFLDVINSPNLVGTACNFQMNAISLGGIYADYSLPNELLIANRFAIGTSNQIAENDLRFYPNPTTNSFIVATSHTSFTANDKIEICSTSGQLLYATTLHKQETIIDIANLVQGTYMLLANINGKQHTQILVKN